MKDRSIVIIAALFLVIALYSHAVPVTVFLDNGSFAPGSSNTGQPFGSGSRDATWDVLATAENGLSVIGAAVMEVRMVCFNVNGNSRGADSGGLNGLAVWTGVNNAWMDGGTREAALFQLAVYSDVAKTTEIKGLDITFESIISRVNGSNLSMEAFAGSGEISFVDPGGDLNDVKVYLGGDLLAEWNDAIINSFAAEANLNPDDNIHKWYTIASTNGITFSENDSFWLRRENLAGATDQAYQLGGITFDVLKVGGYAKWASGWDIDIGSETNDYDLDGLLNVYEYGLEGDPTNAADQGTSPEFGTVNVGGTNWFGYIHPQLSDPDSGISYSLALSSDLVSGDWVTNAGYAVSGTNVTGSTLDYVTNITTIVENQKFIRLIIK